MKQTYGVIEADWRKDEYGVGIAKSSKNNLYKDWRPQGGCKSISTD
jgi:hypothetical protein